MKVLCNECGALVRAVAGKLPKHKRSGFVWLECPSSNEAALRHVEEDVKRISLIKADLEQQLAHACTTLSDREAALAKLRKRAAKGGAK